MDQREITVISRLLSSDIKKPTALVHFQRNMSQIEQRIMTLLIFNTQETEPDDKGNYEIRAQFVMDFLGWDRSNNYPRIYEAFRNIKGNDIVWNFLGEDRTLDELMCSFLITLGISRRSGIIRYKFHPELLPIVKNPSVFAKLKLVMLAVLARPKYAYPLYEYVADSYCRGKLVDRISLAKLKEYLGIPQTSYTDYITFKEQVIMPSLGALNRVSDYTIKYKTYREGRRVAGVIFSIERKTHWQQPLLLEKPMEVLRHYFGLETVAPQMAPYEEVETQRFIKAVARYKVSERVARDAIAQHGLSGAKEILTKVASDVKRRVESANPVHDVGAYLARCLHDGFGILTAEKRKVEADKAAQNEQAHHREREEARREAEQKERQQRIKFLVDALAPNERTKYEEQFLTLLKAGEYGSILQGKTLDSPGVRPIFMAFMANELLSSQADHNKMENAKQEGCDS